MGVVKKYQTSNKGSSIYDVSLGRREGGVPKNDILVFVISFSENRRQGGQNIGIIGDASFGCSCNVPNTFIYKESKTFFIPLGLEVCYKQY